MSKINGIYAAGVSILDQNLKLDVNKTILHSENLIKNGCHGVVLFGSTGQSQLISLDEKFKLIEQISKSDLKDQFIIGTGLNSLQDTISLLNLSISFKLNKFLIMPPAYYMYEDKDVIRFYKKLLENVNDCEIILYNFEKLSGYKFSIDCVKKLVNYFPKQIIGVKDSSYNLFEKLEIENFSILPGSETKLLKGLQIGCSGIITATCNVTASLSRKVYDDFFNQKEQLYNDKLCNVRLAFDKFNLISGLHTLLSEKDNSFKNMLPPLDLLNDINKKKLLDDLKKLNFNY
ncbi:MAG: dihydrodipicolinate synthase family protein [Candidatus Pelagibacter sp.]|jgi:4-hydroxy-tetrahydrodipicolinate synthase|tara:strand:- start:477 stop:1343 length:867 start_codon:yes stop_codon:yes gene_type:complete